ncbi:RNA methyltransferase [Pseudoruegeria sp. HB172150]|uniref:RNA methyltransferase n=1 Tax=Pseudoruegeria sp. HB172150 TaxID=2721164 RepID=UPI001556E5C3|nr:RNA methyltransferase [Pseudoruegeria sp. HB172150]
MTDRQPIFVLVRPQMGENIGAAARAMLNFGLDRMRLVAPRDGWPNPKATAMASGAGRLLDRAGLYGTTAEAVADCTRVYATTARPRDLTKQVLTPEAAMQDANARLASGEQVAILFGPERAGLENDDIARASAIISVPVNPEFASLNLAQCALLTAYEWRRQAEAAEPVRMDYAGTEPAPQIEVEKLGDHYEQRLDAAGFFFPETKAPGMKRALRNMWSRLELTRADVQMFHGMLRQLLRRPDDLEGGELRD